MHVVAAGQTGEEFLQVVMHLVVGRIGAEAVEVFGDCADIAGDGPLVVVEDDDEPLGRADDVVQRFQRDAAGEGRVAANRDHVFIRAAQITRRGHAEGGGEGGAGVAGAERVVFTLTAIKKAACAASLAKLAEEIAVASGQQLVDVALVGDVEHELIGRRVEHPVQGNREFDHAKVGTDMPPEVEVTLMISLRISWARAGS